MTLFRLALLSLRNRWLTALLTVISIAVSVALVLGVEKVRNGARSSFADTLSGTDLIVGARTGNIQLMLYSVFRIGDATKNVSWRSYREIAARPEVSWIVPLSLGDTHKGFRVLGTSRGYFKHYRYRGGQQLAFVSGAAFNDLFDAVIGADVARKLGYSVGDRIVVSHGLGKISEGEHGDRPFRISGVLAKTGTPVDRTVHVSLEAIEAIHIDWKSGVKQSGLAPSQDTLRKLPLTPKAITAAMVGVKSKISIFRLQRFVNEYGDEPLVAVLPGVALQELWGLVGTAEQALIAVAAMVVVAALLGLATMILSTLNERRREMAILRSVGARPGNVIALLLLESGWLALLGVVLGTALLYAGLAAVRPVIDASYGLYLPIQWPSLQELAMLALVLCGALLFASFPALRAYRMSLADGMTVQL